MNEMSYQLKLKKLFADQRHGIVQMSYKKDIQTHEGFSGIVQAIGCDSYLEIEINRPTIRLSAKFTGPTPFKDAYNFIKKIS